MRRLNKRYILCLLLMLTGNLAAAGSQSILIEKLQAISSLHLTYTQTDGVNEPVTGEIWLSKPDRFRLESSAPLSQTIVSNGQYLWTWDRDLDQVIITDLAGQADNIPLLLLVREPHAVLERFSVEQFNTGSTEHFVLKAGDPEQLVESLVLSFDENGLGRVMIENALGDKVVVDLSPAPEGHEFSYSVFDFVSPEGADIIDDRD